MRFHQPGCNPGEIRQANSVTRIHTANVGSSDMLETQIDSLCSSLVKKGPNNNRLPKINRSMGYLPKIDKENSTDFLNGYASLGEKLFY